MNTDLLKISLNLGKKFNNYQRRIKNDIFFKTSKETKLNYLKENFVSSQDEQLLRPQDDGYKSVIQNQTLLTNNNNKSNEQQLKKLTDLQDKYKQLIQQYNH